MVRNVAKSGRRKATVSHQPTANTGRRTVGGGHAGPRDPVEPRRLVIAEAAYFLALARDFAPGQELDDWLQAERDIDATLPSASES